MDLDIPHRKFKTPRVINQRVRLKGYQGTLRQVLIRDLGHDEPTILLTNDNNSRRRPILTRYARPMLIENGLSDAVDFFHLDHLSSAVALNVDFDVLLTVIGSGIHRMFPSCFAASNAPRRARSSDVFSTPVHASPCPSRQSPCSSLSVLTIRS
jgi:hypothetical protein